MAQHPRIPGVQYDEATRPSIAAGANVGTTPTLALGVGATDFSGSVSVTVGGSPAAGNLATVTFGTAFGYVPAVVLTPTIAIGASTYKLYTIPTTTGFTVQCTNTPTAADVVTVNYIVI